MDSTDALSPQDAPDRSPTGVFGPARSSVVASLVIALVFVVVLEFLVFVSFLGRRLWKDPRMFHDLVFTLPLLLWLAVLVIAVIVVLRGTTAWMRVDEQGLSLRGLARGARMIAWSDVSQILAVHDIDRRPIVPDEVIEPDQGFEGAYLLDHDGRELLTLRARLVGTNGQCEAIARARAAGVAVEEITRISPKDLAARVPGALGFADLHPRLMMLAVIVFYLGHNILTFAVWGL